MKKISLILSIVCLLLVLCACNSETKKPEEPVTNETNVQEEVTPTEEEPSEADLVGVWEGDGTMDIMGLDHAIEFTSTWTFQADGTAVSEKILDDGSTESTTFTYDRGEDTLSFSNDDGSCSISYTLEGDVLSFRTGLDTFAVFNRQK